MKRIGKHWPLILAVGVLWSTLALLLAKSLAMNDGHLVYALDDPYIHMAIAKHLAENGVWGVTKYQFTSAASSLTWPLLLALVCRVIGSNDISPFVLNVLFATALLSVVYACWQRYGLSRLMTAAGLLAIIFFAPLPAVIFCGQEHILHALLTVMAVYLAAGMLVEKDFGREPPIALLILLPIFMATRYESLAILLIICILLAFRGRLKQSILLGVLGILPMVIYGIISVSKGWYAIPNPVLLKATPEISQGIGRYLLSVLQQMNQNPDMMVLALWGSVAFYLLYAGQRIIWREQTIMLAILVPAALLHMIFGRMGWFYRYDAYLIVLSLFAVVPALSEYAARGLIRKGEGARIGFLSLALIIFISCLPLLDRAAFALYETPLATQNIYSQQYQMAKFLRDFYQSRAVAVNDIGAVNYFADLRCLDLWGLADREVLEAKRASVYDCERIASLASANDVEVAVVFDDWFAEYGGLPSQWVKVGQWMTPNNIICGSPIVSFYAVNPSEAGKLAENLRVFYPTLPKHMLIRMSMKEAGND